MMAELEAGVSGSSDAPLMVLDVEGKILVWNHGCTKLTGYGFEDVRGKCPWECLTIPEETERIRAAFRKAVSVESTFPLEAHILDKAGQRHCVEWLHHVVRRSDGGVDFVSALGFVRPDPQHDEPARSVYQAIIAGVSDAILAVDEQQRVVVYNDAAARIFGWSPGEVIGQRLDLLLPGLSREIHAAKPPANAVCALAHARDGARFPTEVTASELEVEGVRLAALVVRNCTTQKSLEREQQFLAEIGAALSVTLDLDELLSSVARIAVRFLADCCIIHWLDEQRAFRTRAVHVERRMLPLTAALENVPLEPRELPFIQGNREHQASGVVQGTREQLGSLAQSREYLRLLEQLEPAAYLGVPLSAGGQIIGAMLLICSDPNRARVPEDAKLAGELARRTARAIECAKLYRAAQYAAAMRQDVLGVVAHDLRTPISAARLAAQCLVREEPHERRKAARRSVDLLLRALDRANHLVNDLLDVTQVEAGRISLERASLAPEQIVADVVEMFSAAAETASLSLVNDARGSLPRVLADPNRVFQLFSNLVGNAIKFTPQGGTVSVGADRQASEVRFWVRDTGPGIPHEHIPHLFDRFWQSRQTYRRGVGLGLGIARGIVAAHGGRIWVDSTPGAGSTFYFTLCPVPGEPSA